MKKIIYFLGALLLLTACEGQPGPQGPVGPQGPQGPAGPAGKDGVGLSWDIIDIDIKSEQWQYSNNTDNNFYYAVCNIPEIDEFAYNNGTILVYQENTTSNGGKTQNLLPAVRHYEYLSMDIKTDTVMVGDKPYYSKDTTYVQGTYTQTTDYEYWIGGMEFYITNSDFYYNPADLAEPGDRHFRLVIMK